MKGMTLVEHNGVENKWSDELEWVNQYILHSTEDELSMFSAADIEQMAVAHRKLAGRRERGQAVVDVIDVAGASTVLLATDDMSFLVSSVTAQIAAKYGGIATLIHPTFIVQRDDAGNLVDLKGTGLAQPVASGDTVSLPSLKVSDESGRTFVESWIAVRLTSLVEGEDRARLIAEIAEILDDVKVAAADRAQMVERVLAIADSMGELQDITLGGPEHYSGFVNSEDDPASRVAPVQEFLRWLTRGNFLLLGVKARDLSGDSSAVVLEDRPGSALGILRYDADAPARRIELTGTALNNVKTPHPLYITKANSRSTVHRHDYLDYIGVRDFDSSGKVVGEYVILGLFSMQAYALPAAETPLVRERVAIVRRRLGFHPGSHSDKTLSGIIEDFPRLELLHSNVESLTEMFRGIMGLEERRTTRLFLRPDAFGRFVSAVVFLPRDRYNTAVRQRIEEVFRSEFDLLNIDFEVRLSTSSLARLYFRLRLTDPNTVPQLDVQAIEKRLQQTVRSWGEAAGAALEEGGRALAAAWAEAVPMTYRADYEVADAVEDVAIFESLDADAGRPAAVRLVEHNGVTRLKTYLSKAHTLTELLPVMQNMGLTVLDQKPYEITPADGRNFLLYDFGVQLPEGVEAQAVQDLYEDSLNAFLKGLRESDSLDRLLLAEQLSWQQVAILRAYTHYLIQLGRGFTPQFMADTLLAFPQVTGVLVRYFAVSFDPDLGLSEQEREDGRTALWADFEATLGEVPTLDADRFLRSLGTVMAATLRTNAYVGSYSRAIKIDPEAIDFAPLPRPKFEIFVYSPRVEGVHLRFGPVARGGLRWSDRREDFRTEVLGLVKAQMVKNSVIIPTGAKGGFYPKQLPNPAVDRDAWITEGRESYKIFIRSLLDVTDNLEVAGDGTETVVHNPRVIARDGDDYYLVVAADKGTAAFSDTANSISEEYGFWLGDAFASGGSVGYDHKAMGITARGAWESVKRHFSELGINCQEEEFIAVGIGDMSGDVFGNGMMRSRTTRLVAAFDHRDIFLDPNPDAATSFEERVRLYETPRSSWQDYNRELISAGGGVYSRGAKSIDITPEVREALGISSSVEKLAPAELVSAILRAPVDLVYNGGIGTYVKAASETHAEVGDKANDALRINGGEIRAKIVGEGGNLGFTQLGRIEAAEAGVLINTDAIDNSAGVETSDREVNIKILVDRLVTAGRLSANERASFIESHREDVGAQVLQTNVEQNVLLQAERHGVIPGVEAYIRLIGYLEQEAGLNREVEFIPGDQKIRERYEATGITLTAPELSVLAAYVKIHLTHQLQQTNFADDPWLGGVLRSYFPPALVERFGDALETHPLRREIICTQVANEIVNIGGITHVYRVIEETGAPVDVVARAFMVSRETFGLADEAALHRALPADTPLEAWQSVIRDWQRILDRLVRWFIAERSVVVGHPIADMIERFSHIKTLRENLPDYLSEDTRARVRAKREQAQEWGLSEELTVYWIRAFESFALMDVLRIAEANELDADQVAHLYFSVYDRFYINDMLTFVSHLPRTDRWETLARSALRDDLYEIAAAVALKVAREQGLDASMDTPQETAELLRDWVRINPVRTGRVDDMFDELRGGAIAEGERPRLAVLSVMIRTLRAMVTS
nr:NAD-glutamate dehydrogenase [Rothia sp. ZJ1223]